MWIHVFLFSSLIVVRDTLLPHKSFCNILYPAHGGTSQIYLNENLFHTILPSVILLDDGGFKEYSF